MHGYFIGKVTYYNMYEKRSNIQGCCKYLPNGNTLQGSKVSTAVDNIICSFHLRQYLFSALKVNIYLLLRILVTRFPNSKDIYIKHSLLISWQITTLLYHRYGRVVISQLSLNLQLATILLVVE